MGLSLKFSCGRQIKSRARTHHNCFLRWRWWRVRACVYMRGDWRAVRSKDRHRTAAATSSPSSSSSSSRRRFPPRDAREWRREDERAHSESCVRGWNEENEGGKRRLCKMREKWSVPVMCLCERVARLNCMGEFRESRGLVRSCRSVYWILVYDRGKWWNFFTSIFLV